VGLDAVVQGGDRFAVDRFAGQHHLEAVVVRRVVAAGDHDARARAFEHIGGEVDHRGGDHAEVDDVDAGGLQALGQRCRQLRARQAAIAADHDAAFAFASAALAEGLADAACHAGVERLVDHAADVIGLENRF
jgi:hypothetical protein